MTSAARGWRAAIAVSATALVTFSGVLVSGGTARADDAVSVPLCTGTVEQCVEDLASNNLPALDVKLQLPVFLDSSPSTLDADGQEVSTVDAGNEQAQAYSDGALVENIYGGSVDMSEASASGTSHTSGYHYSCVQNHSTRKFFIHKPAYVTASNRQYYTQYEIAPYSQDDARYISGVGYTWQYELCVVGGATSQNGWRLRMTGIAATDTDNSHRLIGQAWTQGQAVSPNSVNLGFSIGSGGQSGGGTGGGSASINGSVELHAIDTLEGGQGKVPYADAYINTWPDNAMWADWNGEGSTSFSGSDQYEGTVGHGLWEYPMSNDAVHHFHIEVFADLGCPGNWLNPSCG